MIAFGAFFIVEVIPPGTPRSSSAIEPGKKHHQRVFQRYIWKIGQDYIIRHTSSGIPRIIDDQTKVVAQDAKFLHIMKWWWDKKTWQVYDWLTQFLGYSSSLCNSPVIWEQRRQLHEISWTAIELHQVLSTYKCQKHKLKSISRAEGITIKKSWVIAIIPDLTNPSLFVR